MLRLSVLFSLICVAASVLLQRDSTANNGIHLAVSPVCGTLSGNASDVNSGLDLSSYTTIVAFGDGYTAGGTSNGSPLPPAVLVGTSPLAGGRLTNGPLWVEDIANDIGAALKDYAVAGAVTEPGLWPGATSASSLATQINTFAGQEDAPNAATTLYTIFIGIEDFQYAYADNEVSRLQSAAEEVIYEILSLTSSPVFAKNILVIDNYGLGTETAAGDAYKQSIFSGLGSLQRVYGVNVGFVDLKTIWDGVLNGSPGYAAFGYTSPGACTISNITTVGACLEPATTFYWIPGYPSLQTHRIVATFIEEALTQCVVS